MRALLLIALFVGLAACHDDFSSWRYQKQTAVEKMTQLWGAIKADTTPYGYWGTLSKLGLFFEEMKPTFDNEADVLPEGRKKLIHPVGSIAQVEFVAEKNTPYTGMFKGASQALIRMSVAGQADSTKPPAGNFKPGMAIKLLRNGVSSANLPVMLGLEGQDSWNIFKYDWTHHISIPCTFAMKIGTAKFSQASPYVGRIGLKPWAQYDEAGRLVEDSNLKIPFRLIFRPTSQVNSLFPDTYDKDVFEQLATIPAGTTLYDVYAAPKAHADAVKIGSFRTKSKFTTSEFADRRLFFQHNYFENDLKIHPEWKPETETDPPVPSRVIA